MGIGRDAALRVIAQHGAGETTFRVRAVTLGDGRLGCCVPDRLARLVEREPRVRLDDAGEPRPATVVRSGRVHAEVHGRLRASRRVPARTSDGPVLLIDPG